MLRREKKMKDKNGRPIVSLPEKHIDIQYLTFSEDERKIYDALCESASANIAVHPADAHYRFDRQKCQKSIPGLRKGRDSASVS